MRKPDSTILKSASRLEKSRELSGHTSTNSNRKGSEKWKSSSNSSVSKSSVSNRDGRKRLEEQRKRGDSGSKSLESRSSSLFACMSVRHKYRVPIDSTFPAARF